MDWIFFLSLSPLPQPNCNLKSVQCKYCYCRRHNQTFMRERDLGRSRESRSRICLQASETAALLSTPLALSKPLLCLLCFLRPFPLPRLLSLLFTPLFLSSHLYSSTLSLLSSSALSSLHSSTLFYILCFVFYSCKHFSLFSVQLPQKKCFLNHSHHQSEEIKKTQTHL